MRRLALVVLIGFAMAGLGAAERKVRTTPSYSAKMRQARKHKPQVYRAPKIKKQQKKARIGVHPPAARSGATPRQGPKFQKLNLFTTGLASDGCT